MRAIRFTFLDHNRGPNQRDGRFSGAMDEPAATPHARPASAARPTEYSGRRRRGRRRREGATPTQPAPNPTPMGPTPPCKISPRPREATNHADSEWGSLRLPAGGRIALPPPGGVGGVSRASCSPAPGLEFHDAGSLEPSSLEPDHARDDIVETTLGVLETRLRYRAVVSRLE